MATTLDNATLTVSVREDITLNGRKLGGQNVHKIKNINEVSERVLTVPTSEVKILGLSGTIGAGTYVTSDLQYIRLTNLDNTNFVRLSFVSGSSADAGAKANRFDVKLEAERTMIFTNASISGSNENLSFSSFSNFTDLKAKADTGAVDLELFVASK
jgi:hypothetical protein|tara:strand:+ start:244 stop:714 length:471 start_codon:yes stop_codon:yes gene_type:complete